MTILSDAMHDEYRRVTTTALETAGFVHVADWSLDSQRPLGLRCTAVGSLGTVPSTYLMVAVSGADQGYVLYAGKASDGFAARRAKHADQQKRDGAVHQALTDHCGRDDTAVRVYERPAGWVEQDGLRGSANDAEEQMLMARYRPLANKPGDIARALRFQQ